MPQTPENPLIGTWRMLDWYNVDAHGTEHRPLGAGATGYISYSPDGFVFVHLMAANREPYAGDRVTHHVTHASCPNWVGADQPRDIRFDGATLDLSTKGAVFQGITVDVYVLWERAVS